jgi:hypothetical protein
MGSEDGSARQKSSSNIAPTRVPDMGDPPGAASKTSVQSFTSSDEFIIVAGILIIFLLAFQPSALWWGSFFIFAALLVVISRHNWWPWIGLLVLAVLVIPGIQNSLANSPAVTPTVGATRLVPVPSSKLQLGTGLLLPDHILDLTVIVPVEGQPSQRYLFPNLRVDQLLGDNGPVSVFQRSDIKIIVLAVPAEIAEELQSVLALEASTIAYSLLPAATPALKDITETLLPDAGQGVVDGTPSTATPSPAEIYVTLPIDKLTGGTGPLAIGEYIAVDVYVPAGDDPSLPEPVSFPSLRVAGLFSDTGPVSTINWNAVQEILVEVSAEEAPLLQAVLSKEDARIIYRQIQYTPTPTESPTGDETAATVTETPPFTEVSIPVKWFQNLDPSLEAKGKARLVVVVRSGADATAEASSTVPVLRAQEFCVTITMPPATPAVTVTPADTAIPTAHAQDGSVSFRLDLKDFARYAESITAPEAIFLVADPNCP